MIHYVKGDLLDSDCHYICHQVNCQGVMGSGIAKQIRERWPWVFSSYHEYCSRHLGKTDELLGEIWGVRINDSTNQWVVNMFSQDKYGYDGSRFTSYDAFAECLTTMINRLPRGSTIGFPKNIGCGLGGGNWKVISALIEEILGEDFDVYIYELED
jgi:O-acetyl-ADP-ribose deacetylase (regulator of RNase III)